MFKGVWTWVSGRHDCTWLSMARLRRWRRGRERLTYKQVHTVVS